MRTTARALGILLALILVAPTTPSQGASRIGQFVIRCPYSHTLADDPIVFPGQPGASHVHDFFGNRTVDASSTQASLLAGDTTCKVPSDTAGYWAPAAYLNGQQIEPVVMRIYYFGDVRGIQTIPAGLQMIGGNKDATSPGENPHVRWYCGQIEGERTPRLDHPYDCRPWEAFGFVDGVIAIIEMPNCWSGDGLLPEDVAYPIAPRECPPGFPHLLPRLSQRVHLGIMNPMNPDGTVALTLSSGPYYTLHSDFWNAWQQERLDELVRDCLAAGVHCGSVDETRSIDWTSEFGTMRYDLAYATAVAEDGVYVAGFTNFALPDQQYHRRYDAFVRKYDPSGEVLWTRQFGTSGTDQALGLTADASGVVVVGSTDGRFPKQAPAGGLDAFVAGFGPGGRRLWLRQFGTPGTDEAVAVARHGSGLVLAGSTDGVLGRAGVGGTDAFVGRFTSEGEPQWIRQFGSSGTDRAHDLGLGSGAVHVVGSTDGELPGKTALGGVDAFVATFGADGGRGWSRQFGTEGTDEARSILALPRGSYITGLTDGALTNEPPAGGSDGFLMRLDRRGQRAWLRQFGSAASDDAVAVAGNDQAIYVAGSTTGALPGQELLGETDGFVRRFEPKGAEVWTLQFGTIDYDKVYALALGPGAAYVAGTTHGTFDGQVNAGDRDVFLTRVALS